MTSSPVFHALLPVVLLIAVGFLAGKRGWIGGSAVRELSNLVFLLLAPALLFRAMSTVQLQALSFKPVAAYFIAVALIYAGTLWRCGFNRTAAVLALSNTYSNAVMIGIPLIGLAYGDAGTVVLLTLVSLHSLVLLTGATVVLELAAAREQASIGAHEGERRHVAATIARAVRNALVHPVPLPVIAGLLFAQTGLAIPAVLDQPLQLLGQAFSPMALVLVGLTLATTPIGAQLGAASRQAMIKNVLHPLCVAAAGWLLGVRGLPLQVMVVAASLPIGANVFMFAQRYQVAQSLVTASVAVSTLMALATVSAALALVGYL